MIGQARGGRLRRQACMALWRVFLTWLAFGTSGAFATSALSSHPLEDDLLVVGHAAAGFRDGQTAVVRCQVSYPTDRRLLSLAWAPVLPGGWSLIAATGQGVPEVRAGEVILTGLLTNNPLTFDCQLRVPPGETDIQTIGGRVEYQLTNMSNPSETRATPDPLVVTNLNAFFFVEVTTANGGKVTPGSGWHFRDSSPTFLAEATNGFVFTHWQGTFSGGTATNNPLSLRVTGPLEIQAGFVSLTTLLPAPPESLTATVLGPDAIALSWRDMATNETGFEIERRIGLGGAWEPLAIVGADSVQHTDSGLLPNTFHAYRVRSFNSKGASAFCPEAAATTSAEGPECGYALEILQSAWTVDGQATALPATIAPGARLGGALTGRQSSPTGDGAPQRVAIGFRSADGRAVGACVEIADFAGIPGCPGVERNGVAIPTGLDAPTEPGIYELWIEAYVTYENPRDLFLTSTRTLEEPTKCRLGAVAVSPPLIRAFAVMDGQGMVNDDVSLPIRITAYGDENAMAFSLSFDSQRLEFREWSVGTDARSLLIMVHTNTAPAGHCGFVGLLPSGQSLEAGSREIVRALFRVRKTGMATVSFADYPTYREAVDNDASELPATWTGATVVGLVGFEGDVTPQPAGNGLVTWDDYLMIGQFAAAPETVPPGSQFQRVDCAPRGSGGNGYITVADAVQARRYAEGIDPLISAAGPTAPPGSLAAQAGRTQICKPLDVGFELTVGDQAFTRGATNWTVVMLNNAETVEALSFTMKHDPDLLAYMDCRLVGAGTNAALHLNMAERAIGSVGMSLLWPAECPLPAGTNAVLQLCYAAAPGASQITSEFAFAAAPTPLSLVWNGGEEAVPNIRSGHAGLYPPPPPPQAPQAPVWVSAETMSAGEIYLSWADPEGRARFFEIERQSAGGGAWQRIAAVAAPLSNYVDHALAPGVRYRYVVRGRGSELGYSPYSVVTSAVTWTGLELWRRERFGAPDDQGLAANDADPDGDGLPNFMEYALGFNPRRALTARYARIGFERVYGDHWYMTFEYDAQAPPTDDVALWTETCDDLTALGWASNTVPLAAGWSNGVFKVKVRAQDVSETKRHEFIRLRVGSK